jgi:hypothetical protein
MHRHHTSFGVIVATLCVAVLGLGGCASTKGGGGATTAKPSSAPASAPAKASSTPAKKADVKSEVGANGLPTPAALIARYVDALGGEAAIKKHQSSTRKGKMAIAAMGMEGQTVIKAAAPDKMVTNIETGMGAMNQGYNGTVGWSDNPMTGAQVLSGDQLETMKVQADFYAPLNYAKHYKSMETVGEEQWAGQAAYKVKMVNMAGKEQFQYFSKDTGLLLGLQGVQAGPMGESEVKITMTDYKDFGGSKLPGKMTIDVAGMQIEQTVESVTYDDVDAAAFELPASVKAIAK